MTNEQREKITTLRHQGFGYTAIANSVGLSKDSVKAYCRSHGLAGEKAESHSLAEVPTQLCLNCGKTLIQIPGRKQKKFCCPECRTAWWNAHPEAVKQKAVYTFTCPECGKEFTAYGNAKPTKTVDELAREVIRGLWGNGTDRKNRLTAAGYDYYAVQARVNELLR